MKVKVVALFTLALVAILVMGCTGDSVTPSPNDVINGSGAVTGFIEVRIHDAPPEYDVQEVWVTIDEIELHKAAAEQNREEEPVTPGTPAFDGASGTPVVEPTPPEEGKGEWITLDMSGTNPVDIIQYQDGLEALLAFQELEAGKYTQIRLAISKVEVVYLDESGSETQTAEAMLPSDKLKFTRPFDVVAGETTVLSFDFIVDKSIVITGAGEIILKPVLTLDVAYEGGEDGKGAEPGDDEGETPDEESTPGKGHGNDKGNHPDGVNNPGNSQGADKGNAPDEVNNPGNGQVAAKGNAPDEINNPGNSQGADKGNAPDKQSNAGNKGKPAAESPEEDPETDIDTGS